MNQDSNLYPCVYCRLCDTFYAETTNHSCSKAGTGIVEDDTLRDRFAMACLQGLMVRDADFEATKEYYTKIAYEYADEMMKARSKPPVAE